MRVRQSALGCGEALTSQVDVLLPPRQPHTRNCYDRTKNLHQVDILIQHKIGKQECDNGNEVAERCGFARTQLLNTVRPKHICNPNRQAT